MASVLDISQLPADIRQQVMGFAPDKRRRFLRKVVGAVMQGQIIVRFLRGGYITKGDWKSTATGEKQLDNRFSKSYKKRPSGSPVVASSIRMVDTRELGNSYRVLEADANSVTVGPGKTAHNGVADKIAERQEKADNFISGFTSETITALNTEIQNYLDRIANGETPPYLPKSRLTKKEL